MNKASTSTIRRCAILCIVFCSSLASAKTMTDRIGLGMTYHKFKDTTALSTRFYPWDDVAIGLFFGVNTYQGSTSTLLGVRAQKLLLSEEQLIFFGALNTAILSDKPSAAASADTGLEIDALVGAEFFLAGLPRLGLTFETGLALRSLRGVALQTTGGAIFNSSIHYYF